MNKTLVYVGTFSLGVAFLIFVLSALVLWYPSVSHLEFSKLLEKINVANGVAIIFTAHGTICVFLGRCEFT